MGLARKIDPRLSVEQFVDWAETQLGDERYELVDGFIYAMGLEAIEHGRAKGEVFASLREALKGSPCEAHVDSLGIRTSEFGYRVPDVLVDCGVVPPGGYYADKPVVVVEVVSPSTEALDVTDKRSEYLALPSVRHYVVIFTEAKTVFHYVKSDDGSVLQETLVDGSLELSVIDVTLSVESLFGAAP